MGTGSLCIVREQVAVSTFENQTPKDTSTSTSSATEKTRRQPAMRARRHAQCSSHEGQHSSHSPTHTHTHTLTFKTVPSKAKQHPEFSVTCTSCTKKSPWRSRPTMSEAGNEEMEQALESAIETFGDLTVRDEGWRARARHWIEAAVGDPHMAAALYMSIHSDESPIPSQQQPSAPSSTPANALMPMGASSSSKYNAEQLDRCTWKIVEDDGFGQV
jgi:hypothetical protein